MNNRIKNWNLRKLLTLIDSQITLEAWMVSYLCRGWREVAHSVWEVRNGRGWHQIVGLIVVQGWLLLVFLSLQSEKLFHFSLLFSEVESLGLLDALLKDIVEVHLRAAAVWIGNILKSSILRSGIGLLIVAVGKEVGREFALDAFLLIIRFWKLGVEILEGVQQAFVGGVLMSLQGFQNILVHADLLHQSGLILPIVSD